jgi:uncharacterized protein
LPIIIGGFEAQAIAIELEKIKTPRPLTHDLFKSFAEAFEITITEVIINKFHEGVFYAILVCNNNHDDLELDSRTSDAIALALRFGCPIFTYESIMASAGIIIEEETEESKAEGEREDSLEIEDVDYSGYSLADLQEMLQSAVENEEYEKASRLRDEIKKRSGEEK